MLILPRRRNESINIGGDIVLTVVEVRDAKVRLGLSFPEGTSVHRKEVWDLLYGPPPGVVLDPVWLTWNDGTIPRLARGIAEGDYDALPVLADALEEAGCTDAAILDHCRSCGGHVRSSWVVDLILSDETHEET
jgi:carbon storage regulator CsrA